MQTMMALGPYRFELATAAYQSLIRSTVYRWESQERIGRHPALQFIGEGHTNVDLDGVIYPSFAGGLGQIDLMRAIAGFGTPLMLIGGTGRVFGSFAILSVDETQTYFHADGTARKLEFAISLQSYGADRGFF